MNLLQTEEEMIPHSQRVVVAVVRGATFVELGDSEFLSVRGYLEHHDNSLCPPLQ